MPRGHQGPRWKIEPRRRSRLGQVHTRKGGLVAGASRADRQRVAARRMSPAAGGKCAGRSRPTHRERRKSEVCAPGQGRVLQTPGLDKDQ